MDTNCQSYLEKGTSQHKVTRDTSVFMIDKFSTLEFNVFHAMDRLTRQSTPVIKDQRKGDISSDQYNYLHSLIKDQAKKLKSMETEMIRLRAELKKLKACSLLL